MTREAGNQTDIIGIDLGTTNSAVAWAPGAALSDAGAAIRGFEVPQLVSAGEVAPCPVLPSFLYLSQPDERTPGSLDLPWNSSPSEVVGTLARDLGARVPGRLVASAKSWLCHAHVDRSAAILPWGATGQRYSPVDACARYLGHLRDAWNHRHPDRPMEDQDVVVTVPASFDEVARELTVRAARAAGLEHITLLEEPQAALYAWIDGQGETWAEQLEVDDIILVVDVGGGTTDLSLVRVGEDSQGKPTLERFAVGRHLMLGGDNMDLALAHVVESRLQSPARLDSARWLALTQRCRDAKEELLARGKTDQVSVQVLGAGSSVIGGSLTAAISRSDVEQVILDGFVPLVEADAHPAPSAPSALTELGLPYEGDPAITRHLAEFLARHGEAGSPIQPTSVLFNGGALKGAGLRRRIVRSLKRWCGGEDTVRVLEGTQLDLAVARGAAYYGLVRRGHGVRIGGGSARAYYVEVASGDSAEILCIAPRGMEEGSRHELREHPFQVRTNRPVAFRVLASTAREGDRAGDLVSAPPESLEALPPIHTVLRFGKATVSREIPVHLRSTLTEVGTLDLHCSAVETEHQWRLEMQVRGTGGGRGAGGGERADREHLPEDCLGRAAAVAAAAFAPERTTPEGLSEEPSPLNLGRLLEEVLDQSRERWSLSTARAIWQEIYENQARRQASEAHEARWLNLVGFCLRPGFGFPLDDWRMGELWKIFHGGTAFPRSDRCRGEWWILWRRIGGGLSAGQQSNLADLLEKDLRAATPGGGAKRSKRGGAPRPRRLAAQERIEMLMAVASLERLDPAQKVRLATLPLAQIERGRPERAHLWALARLGARVPLYGPLDRVVPAREAGAWIDALLALDGPIDGPRAEALTSLARPTGDRARDLDDPIRDRVRSAFERDQISAHHREALDHPTRMDADDTRALFGEALPPGIILAG